MSDSAVIKPTLKSLQKTTEKILNSGTPEEYIKKSGINLLDIYKRLGEIALHSELITRGKFPGEVEVLGPDNRSSLAAIGMILELHKHLKDKSVVTQVGIFNDPKIVSKSERVLKLRDKIG